MKTRLSQGDLEVISESLKFTVFKFENYQGYPSERFRQSQIDGVNLVRIKISEIKKEMKGGKK